MLDKSILTDNTELERYAVAVDNFLAGTLDAERFQSIRLQQGIYGQRQDGVNMVRIKVPGGRLSPAQAHCIADVVDRYSNHSLAHITTRQSVQVHHVPLADTPTVLRQLAESGLTTREACNNTIRNMTACPLAGVCPAEHTDIGPVLEQAAAHFLRHPLTQHLPRKFKLSFSGCERDCAQGMIHDVGVVAVRRGDEFGFKLLAGGGLGHKPHEAIVIAEFVPETELLASLEAVISVHQRFSQRKLRAKSRIKFLVDRFGASGFIEKYHEERQRTLTALADQQAYHPHWRERGETRLMPEPGAPRATFAQRQAGLNVIPLHIPQGNISAEQLSSLADIMAAMGLHDLRTTQDQNLALFNVQDDLLDSIHRQLTAAGLRPPAGGDNIVTCPGTSTCRLGITASMSLGTRLTALATDLRLHISGCQNGCAQPETADIGIYGEARRVHNRLLPHYQVYIGGDGRAQRGLGLKTRSIPAMRIDRAINEIEQAYLAGRDTEESFFAWSRRQSRDYFDNLLADTASIDAAQVNELVYEPGNADEFTVLQFGGGECAGAAQETIAALFAEAANERNYRNAFFRRQQYNDSIDCARRDLRLVGQALLYIAAQEPLTDLTAIAERLEASLHDGRAVATALLTHVEALQRCEQALNASAYRELMAAMDDWSARAAEICEDLDRQLDLSAAVTERAVRTDATTSISTIDLSSYGCPLHYIKARNTLRQYQSGAVIDFVFASGDPARQAASSLASDGHNVMTVEENGVTTQIRVRKSA